MEPKTIPLSQGKVAVVDAADYEWLGQWNWFAHRQAGSGVFNAVRKVRLENGRWSRVRMQRVILGVQEDTYVYFKNGDSLDNRRENITDQPPATDPIIDGRGYLVIKSSGHHRANASGYVKVHVLIAEKALGRPLPPKAEVHHVNRVKHQSVNTNLVICENHAYHLLLHRRQRVLEAGGRPGLDKVCSNCRKVKPMDEFHTSPNESDGRGHACKACQSENIKRLRREGRIHDRKRKKVA